MSFPVIATTASNSGGSTTSPVVNLPSGIQSGDLLLAVLNYNNTGTSSWPSPWVRLSHTANGSTLDVAYKIATGLEGSTITVTLGTSGSYANACYRITGYTGNPVVSTASTGSNTAPDPPTLNNGGSAKDYLWLAICGVSGGPSIVSWPANYTLSQIAAGGTPQTTVAIAGYDLNGTTQNPAAFGIGATSHSWQAQTVAVTGTVTPQPGAAALVLTGATPVVLAPARSQPSAVSVTLTGATPVVLAPARSQPSAVSIALTPATPTVLTPRVSVPGSVLSTDLDAFQNDAFQDDAFQTKEAPALTGATPAVLTPRVSVPGSVTLTLTGATPAIVTPVVSVPSEVDLVTTTSAPIIGAQFVVSPASLTLTPAIPSVTAPTLSLPSPASLTTTLGTPYVSAGGSDVVIPFPASLAITGAVPAVTVTGAIADTHHAGLIAPWVQPRARFVEYNGRRVYLTRPDDEEEELLLLGVL